MPDFRSPINLNIPETPVGIPDEWQPVISGIYNALRALQNSIGGLTGASYETDTTFFHSMEPSFAESIQVANMSLIRVEATVNILAGEMVNLFLSGGVLKARHARATGIATRAWGWAKESVTAGNQMMVALQFGHNGSFGGLTIGATYYLSEITPGGISTAKPVALGRIIQEVGIALSATELLVRMSTPIVI